MVASKFGRLDVLINNAAISNDSRLADAGVSARAVFMEQFNTNLFGVAQVTEAFLPLLERSTTARLVFTSSRVGSLSQRCDESDKYYSSMIPVYRSSKAALNMLCLHYAAKYKGKGWKVNAVDPGHVATNLNRFTGPDPVESGAVQLVRMATLGDDGPTGTFSSTVKTRYNDTRYNDILG
jgi:NAD(P)-dependent dehydrogenase (short-subunit alcohol dehydrogenase family)